MFDVYFKRFIVYVHSTRINISLIHSRKKIFRYEEADFCDMDVYMKHLQFAALPKLYEDDMSSMTISGTKCMK